jgi:hypothetical protein
MKSFLFVIGVIVILTACGAGEQTTKKPARTGNSGDTTEYKVVVFDAGFESWFQKRQKPSWYRTENYYETWNTRYAIEWNALVRQGKPGFDTEINYDPAKDYGLEVEHKIYYFFKYKGFK